MKGLWDCLRRFAGGAASDHEGAARWRRVQEILAEAIATPDDERAALFERLDDDDLVREVRSLLAAHEKEGAVDHLTTEVDPVQSGEIRPGVTVGPYEVRAPLGSGGMGVVFQAFDTRLSRPVALKFLPHHLGFDEPSKQRFLLEAQAAASLDHPNICTIHQVGETAGGRLFIAMPCYDGETLKERLGRGRLPLLDALDVALQAARGLARAHQSGIVHRDIKPANLMCTADGTIKILDFGLAKVADVQLTSGGIVMGTVPYMSPEQASGDPIDHRTDLWSLGAVLYEMVAGRRPFQGGNFEGIIASIISDEPVPPARNAGAGELVNRIVASLLAKKPHDRYAAAGEVIVLLEEALNLERGDGIGPFLDSSPVEVYDSMPPDGERRQATVVVGRLADYSSLIEDTAPDALDAALGRLRESVEEIVARHGGTVNRFGGAEFECLFGVPSVHEDDYVRATRAALEIQQRVQADAALRGYGGVGLDIQTGICSGVLAVQRRAGKEGGYKVAGEPLQTAAHLATLAASGETRISAESHRLIAPYFDTEPAADALVPGGQEPLRSYRVVREAEPASRIEALARTGLTEFSGRAAEVAALEQATARAAEAAGQFVTIVGEAGVGKSRLLYEFTSTLDTRSSCILRGRCHAGGATPYRPFVEALRDALEVTANLTGGPEAEAVAASVLSLGTELEDFIPLYLHLLSVTSDRFPLPPHYQGEHFRPAMREALSALFTLRAAKRLTVLLLEDWHWADGASHEALQHLVESATEARLLIVTTYRPGHRITWSDDVPHTSIHLGPLQGDDSARILRSILGVDELPADLISALHERAGGNPFFLEELCLTLRDQGLIGEQDGKVTVADRLDATHLPGTVQGVLRTRLDTLDPDAREVVRFAAVVGRDFSLPILRRALGDPPYLDRALERLKELGIVRRTRVVPDPIYRFRHVLTQEVAYDTLLQHQRRAVHGRVGAAIEETAGDRGPDFLERLAHHFSRAEEWAKGVGYGLAAAEKAETLGEFADALATLDRVEEWTLRIRDADQRHAQLITLLLRQESLCETLGDRRRQQEILSRLFLLLEPDGDPAVIAEVHRRQADVFVLGRQFDEGRRALEKALAISRQLEDLAAERKAIVSLGLACWQEEKIADAVPLLERALAMDRALGNDDAISEDLMSLGQVLRHIGEYDRALEYLEEAAELVTDEKDLWKNMYVQQMIAAVYRSRGDIDKALSTYDELRPLLRTHHLPIPLIYNFAYRGAVLLHLGRIEESIAEYRQGVEVARKARHAEGMAQVTRILGELLDNLGRDDEAAAYLSDAAELFAQLEDRDSEVLMRRRIAKIAERNGRFQESERTWSTLRDLYRRHRDLAGEVDALEGLARAARDGRNDLTVARELLQQALDLVGETGDARREAAVRNVAGNTAWQEGAYMEALTHFERALHLFRGLDEQSGIGLAMNSVGLTLVRLGRREDGCAQLEAAVAFNRDAGERLLEGHGLAALADAHYDDGDFDEAERRYRESLDLRRALGDRRGEGWMLERLARVADARRDFDTALRLRGEAKDIAEATGDTELAEACASYLS